MTEIQFKRITIFGFEAYGERVIQALYDALAIPAHTPLSKTSQIITAQPIETNDMQEVLQQGDTTFTRETLLFLVLRADDQQAIHHALVLAQAAKQKRTNILVLLASSNVQDQETQGIAALRPYVDHIVMMASRAFLNTTAQAQSEEQRLAQSLLFFLRNEVCTHDPVVGITIGDYVRALCQQGNPYSYLYTAAGATKDDILTAIQHAASEDPISIEQSPTLFELGIPEDEGIETLITITESMSKDNEEHAMVFCVRVNCDQPRLQLIACCACSPRASLV